MVRQQKSKPVVRRWNEGAERGAKAVFRESRLLGVGPGLAGKQSRYLRVWVTWVGGEGRSLANEKKKKSKNWPQQLSSYRRKETLKNWFLVVFSTLSYMISKYSFSPMRHAGPKVIMISQWQRATDFGWSHAE